MTLLADAAVFRSIYWIIFRAFVDIWKVIKKLYHGIARKASANPRLPSLFKNVLKSLKERTPKKKMWTVKNVTSNILFYGVSMRVYKCV